MLLQKPILAGVASLSLLAWAVNLAPASAEPGQNGRHAYDALTNPSVNIPRKVSAKGSADAGRPDGYWQHFNKAPKELPGVPLPGGDAKFSHGMSRPQGGSTQMLLQYKMKQPDSSVIASYRDSLQGSGWTMAKQTDPRRIMAVNPHTGDRVVVQAQPYGGQSGFSSTVGLSYTFKGR